MPDYVILSPIEPPEKCYLFEVLLWRAFGRFPEMEYDSEAEDWRFSYDFLDSWAAPVLSGEELSELECQFAGIPVDPRLEYLESDTWISDVNFYEDMLKRCEEDQGRLTNNQIKKLKLEHQEAIRQNIVQAAWRLTYADYVDQFQNEILIDLRRGHLKAYGRELPHPDRIETEKLFKEKKIELFDLDVIAIPPEHWITGDVDWNESSISGRNKAFVWIHVFTNEMTDRYSPEELLGDKEVKLLGDGFAISSNSLNRVSISRSKRGRPSLPWDQFHVEVARMFRDGEMPDKKEAAIATLQEWFLIAHAKSVSRAAVGQKLKPYFDELLKKDRKS